MIIGYAAWSGGIAISATDPNKNSVYTYHLNKNFDRQDATLNQILKDAGGEVAAERPDQRPAILDASYGDFFPRPTAKTNTEERVTWGKRT